MMDVSAVHAYIYIDPKEFYSHEYWSIQHMNHVEGWVWLEMS